MKVQWMDRFFSKRPGRVEEDRRGGWVAAVVATLAGVAVNDLDPVAFRVLADLVGEDRRILAQERVLKDGSTLRLVPEPHRGLLSGGGLGYQARDGLAVVILPQGSNGWAESSGQTGS